jgi:hypothetical protein
MGPVKSKHASHRPRLVPCAKTGLSGTVQQPSRSENFPSFIKCASIDGMAWSSELDAAQPHGPPSTVATKEPD